MGIINTVLVGDALEVLRKIGDQQVNCIVTSPPYWGLRDYGVEGQLGLEKTPQEYVTKMVTVFREARRVLKDDGTLWLNMGDSYSGSGKGIGSDHGKAVFTDSDIKKTDWKSTGLKQKDLIGMPWRLAFALQEDGWYLRADIIWAKTNPMPESVKDRPTRAHEYIFLLSKRQNYYYDLDAIREPVAASTRNRPPVDFGGAKGRRYSPPKGDPNFRGGHEQWGRNFDYRECSERGRNKRSVWTLSNQPFRGAHFAVFPQRLIEPCIKAGCPPQGIVLDPFMGAGTTGLVARKLGRNWLGIELNQAYADMAMNRIASIPALAFQEIKKEAVTP